MQILALFSAFGGAAAGLVSDGAVIRQASLAAEHGLAAALPAMVHDLLAEASPDLIAVTVGPGSFTGLRAGLALAQGLALGGGVPAIGVTTGEAFAVAATPLIGRRVLWTATVARRGRVFIENAQGAQGHPDTALPMPAGPVAVCGNAANAVAAALAARGGDVMLTALRRPGLVEIAAVALRRAAGEMPPVELLPFYVDAPEARPMAEPR